MRNLNCWSKICILNFWRSQCLRLLRPCRKWRGWKKIKSTSFHQYSWNSEVETTWISLIGWHHKTSSTYLDRMDKEHQMAWMNVVITWANGPHVRNYNRYLLPKHWRTYAYSKHIRTDQFWSYILVHIITVKKQPKTQESWFLLCIIFYVWYALEISWGFSTEEMILFS